MGEFFPHVISRPKVEKSLLSLPEGSRYRRCIQDVIDWWREYPDDWKDCWFQVQKEYADDVGCPAGAQDPGGRG